MQTLRFTALVLMLATIVGCGEDTSRWEAAQEETAGSDTATSEAALAGEVFNKYFPAEEDGVDLTFQQEKEGFVQASLRRNGELLGTLSISDTRNNPTARDKYQDSADSVAGFPASVQGNATSILVGDRFQVRLQSEGEALTASDRAAWLQKFDLPGLSNAF